jgi:two-component system, NtrC family, nitrogen regulation response regulator GlnG
MTQLLVIDDEPAICWGLSELGKSCGLNVIAQPSIEAVRDLAFEEPPAAIFLDVRLPGEDGLAAMPALRARWPESAVIVMTAYGDLPTATRALRQGAFEYLLKPFDLATARSTLNRAIARREPIRSSTQVEAAEELIGDSPAMQQVFRQIALAAQTDASVVLVGESGVGKEVAARAIHRYSPLATKPLLTLHVTALSPELIDHELFGQGTERNRPGLLSQANGGTLFIDEVAEIPLATQAKLVRVLESGELTPVRNNKPQPVNFRLISATHRDLPRCVALGDFRHDLYFRLGGYTIALPPLRERIADIPALAVRFLSAIGRPSLRFDPSTLTELQLRPWPGNVRELRSAVQHSATMVREGVILPEHLPVPLLLNEVAKNLATPAEALIEAAKNWATTAISDPTLAGKIHEELLGLVEPPLLAAAISAHHENCLAAAQALGIHRTTLRRKLDQLDP